MEIKYKRVVFLAFLVTFTAIIQYQIAKAQEVSTVFAVLSKAVDSNTAKTGDFIELRTVRDLSVHGVRVIPKGSKIEGHVSDSSSTKTVVLVLDRAVLTGKTIVLQGIIAAISTPPENLGDDPTYSMMHSREPTQTSGNMGIGAPASSASAGAGVATAVLDGGMDPSWKLNESSSGVVGISGLSMNWQFDKTPPATVIQSKKKAFKLAAGSQMMIRMAPPI